MLDQSWLCNSDCTGTDYKNKKTKHYTLHIHPKQETDKTALANYTSLVCLLRPPARKQRKPHSYIPGSHMRPTSNMSDDSITSHGNDVTHKGLQMTIPLHVIMTWCIRNFRNLCLELNHSLLWFNTEIHHTIEMLQEADLSYIIKSIMTPVLNTEQVQATHISVVQQRILSVQHRAVERWALYTHCSIYCSRKHSIINC